MYGITETTVHVTYRRIRREECEEANGSKIGLGIEDLRVYVKDEQARIVPDRSERRDYVGGGD